MEVEGLTKRFGNMTALLDITFSIQKGSFEVVLGPSGCGKTTLLRCIAGVELPDSGRVSINGEVVFSRKDGINVPPEKRRVGMVYQSYALWPHMTVFENVAYPLRVRHYPEQEVKSSVHRMLELLNISELKDRYPTALSGGQQQRVALARALVYQPPLLLLDEPLGGLDEPLRLDVARELRQIQKELGTDAVYVTHNRDEAFWLGDHIIILLDGRLVGQGTGESLLKKPPNSYVARFLSDMLLLEGRVLSSSQGVNLVSTEIGNLLCNDGTENRVNEGVFVGINQRHVLLAGSENQQNVFEGMVLDKGTIQNDGLYRYPLTLGSKKVYLSTEESHLKPGSKVKLWLPPDSCVTMPK